MTMLVIFLSSAIGTVPSAQLADLALALEAFGFGTRAIRGRHKELNKKGIGAARGSPFVRGSLCD